MAYYLQKYVGTYRVKSEYDLDTNDFARDANGNLETDSTYIKCANVQMAQRFFIMAKIFLSAMSLPYNVVEIC